VLALAVNDVRQNLETATRARLSLKQTVPAHNGLAAAVTFAKPMSAVIFSSLYEFYDNEPAAPDPD
jgi:hypothetical protein